MAQQHAGAIAIEVARAHGVERMFTLSGAHVFPLYDGAVQADPPLPLIDVRHEQTAVFAAEATAKLTRRPGLAAVTAGPGVTNAVSAVTTAHFNGSPVLVIGGRAPNTRWGQGSLQELDHPPLLAPVTKLAATVPGAGQVAERVDEALRTAMLPHRGPVFLDVPMDELFSYADAPGVVRVETPTPLQPDPDDLARVASLLGAAERPVLVIGSDVWSGGAEAAALRLAEELSLPVVTNGMGRGIVPRGHDLLVTRARSVAFGAADLVVVLGAPLDFRLGFGAFGGRDGAAAARVVHLADAPSQVAAHVDLAASAAGELAAVCDGVLTAMAERPRCAQWVLRLREAAAAAEAADRDVLAGETDPIHPGRIYGELRRVLDDDAVVIGDGGDFVSFAGKYVEPSRPGCWLDPGPFGCLGTGLGYAIAARLARPSSQVVLLLGDGAAGFSLMDVDSLVRHNLPVVMIIGNNGGWGLEKAVMQPLYGYHVAAELSSATRYDDVVRALGGGGETITHAADIGPALRRAFAADAPYLVNVITDPAATYPRATTGV